MELFLKTPPVVEPLTLEEVKAYLRMTAEHEDKILQDLISTARAHVERITGRSLLKQQWQLDLKPPYPPSSPLVKRVARDLIIRLPKPPLLGIVSVKVKDKPIAFKREQSKVILPTSLMDEEIRITYWAGYGETPASLPPDLKMSVMVALRCFYEQEEIDLSLARPFKVFHLG